MPGAKCINWTESNKAKFLDALLNYAVVRVDENTAQAIASHVGQGCLPRAVHSLLANSKARFKPQNNAPSPASFKRTSVVNGVSKSTPTKLPAKASPKKRARVESDTEDDSTHDRPVFSSAAGKTACRTNIKHEPIDAEDLSPCPSPIKRRSSSRTAPAINYEVLNGGGESGEEKSSDEDSAVSDFMANKREESEDEYGGDAA